MGTLIEGHSPALSIFIPSLLLSVIVMLLLVSYLIRLSTEEKLTPTKKLLLVSALLFQVIFMIIGVLFLFDILDPTNPKESLLSVWSSISSRFFKKGD